ncbi:hypothetical protein [Actinomadura sp. WMMA1423]|uniref:hypothetical protein n=1 Tax=Actinomadura sp. WMMA1423 TaxID=2591108 RepID=UPI00143DC692|nr:hypothetical protein [Actinomadura sp. WMMA1423]
MLLFADGHRIGRGLSGFDLNELLWTADWRAEKAFLLRVLDLAMLGCRLCDPDIQPVPD